MKVFRFNDPDYTTAVESLRRRSTTDTSAKEIVKEIISEVSARGDHALVDYAGRFDGVSLSAANLLAGADELAAAASKIPSSVKKAVAGSLRNIRLFAKNSLRRSWSCRNAEGAIIGERYDPLQRVGVYVPGGKAPLVSSALMTAGFAQAAGVKDIIAATPCGPDGNVHPAILYALAKAGVTEVLKVGGAQAIAAMALGTETIRPVNLIAGPGNRYVVEAKRQLVGTVAIDLLPGPSEVLILSDKTGDASFIAADMLAQAEHGGDSVVGFITDSKALLTRVLKAIEEQVPALSRAAYVKEVLDRGTFAVLVKSMDEGIKITNNFAPEHLLLICQDERKRSAQVLTAGAIYLGNYSAIAVGDFLAGPSHTLPTGGTSHAFSGLRADHFQRRTSIVKLDRSSIARSMEVVGEFARLEGLDAHEKATAIRL